MLRSFTVVVLMLTVVVPGLTDVDVIVGGTFLGSESDSPGTVKIAGFLATGAISFIISFWFSAKIFVRSERISFLRVDFLVLSLNLW